MFPGLPQNQNLEDLHGVLATFHDDTDVIEAVRDFHSHLVLQIPLNRCHNSQRAVAAPGHISMFSYFAEGRGEHIHLDCAVPRCGHVNLDGTRSSRIGERRAADHPIE